MLKDSLRLIKILHTLLKARLDKELNKFDKPTFISFLLFISPWRMYSAKASSGERLRIALEDLGPISKNLVNYYLQGQTLFLLK